MSADNLLLTYMKKESTVPILILNSEREITFVNEIFNEVFKLEKSLMGEKIEKIFNFELVEIIKKESYILEKHICCFEGGSGNKNYYSCMCIKNEDQCLISFEDYMLKEEEIIKEISMGNAGKFWIVFRKPFFGLHVNESKWMF